MSPQLALLLTTAFVAFLFWRDRRERPTVTGALWIPVVWLLITGSRSVSQWVGVGGTITNPSDLAEGSPFDRTIFIGLQLAGLIVLFERRVSLSTIVSRNVWMTVFLVYCALSILWSDFPFAAFKRWFKVLGLPMMVLIVATEPDPREALVRLMKRVAYVLVPFSILLIRYYPELGRGFSEWTGEPYNTGVTTNKNELGYVCLVLGCFFFWHLLVTLRRPKTPERRNELLLVSAFLYMIGWLLFMASSMTSLTSLALGISIVLFLGLRFLEPRRAVTWLVFATLIFISLELLFGLTDALVGALGRDSTLTGRVELWDHLRRSDKNAFFGSGFESFWLGREAEVLWAQYWWRPNQAHNGYLETYLNLGWVGLILLGAWIVSTFGKARDTLFSDFDFGRFRIGALAIVLLYNYTEAAFKGLHFVWFFFYLIATDYSPSQHPSGQSSARTPTNSPHPGMLRQDALVTFRCRNEC